MAQRRALINGTEHAGGELDMHDASSIIVVAFKEDTDIIQRELVAVVRAAWLQSEG